MEKNLLYLKLTGFALAALILAWLTYLSYTLMSAFHQSDTMSLLWLTGFPIVYYIAFITAIGLDLSFLAFFVQWLVQQKAIKTERSRKK